MSVMIAIKPVRGIRLRFAPAWSSDSLNSADAKRKPRGRLIVFAGFLLLAGYWLWCHGCHGDEDNELLSRSSTPHWTKKSRKEPQPFWVFSIPVLQSRRHVERCLGPPLPFPEA
jgi:hypothetical protein